MTSPDDTNTLYWPIRVEQGERKIEPFPIKLGDDPFDATGWAVDAKIKVRPGGPVLHTFSTGEDGDARILADDGTKLQLTILPAVSMTWTWTTGWYRIKITDPNDATNIQRIVQGPFIVDQD